MSRKSYPNVNAANQYARDVVRGKIVACQFVIQACQRHLDDLMAEKSKSFRYRFDKDLAERAAKFIQLLPHTKGEWAFKRMPITLEPWQLFVICCAFGWVNKGTRLRRFREVYTEIPRKNGKSAISAGVALYGNIFHSTSPELIGHAPPLKHREVSHAQQALTAEFFGCQLPHDRGEREIFFSEPLRWLNTFDGRKNRFIFVQGSLAGVSGQRLARRWLGATPGTPRRSSHMRHSWLNFIFRGYKKTMGRAVRKTSGCRDLTRPSPQTVENYYHFNRSRAVFAL
ncbi:hypothetical protein AWF30_24925 [Escherichia coli]|nr:hypothetical protein AWF30_24925 [Escherichia coli]